MLSFTSPEKENIFFIFMKSLLHRKKEKRSTIHYSHKGARKWLW
jgi:hypothetical protein